MYYKGKFKESASLPELIEEVKDIVEVYGWKHHFYAEDFPDVLENGPWWESKVYGISFSPPNCEPVSLTFLENRRMCFPGWLQFLNEKSSETEMQYLFQPFTKTQFAGATVHKLIVHLLKYLNEKYFEEFTLLDDAHYWEKGDEKALDAIFKAYSEMLDMVSDAISNEPMLEGENMEQCFKRILKKSTQRKKGK